MPATTHSGNLRKMQASLPDKAGDAVLYSAVLSEQTVPLNDCIGSTVALAYSGAINCMHCGRKTNKSFNQGFCYPCFKSLAQCDSCIVSPEKCHFHVGTCREPQWAEDHCMTDHFVYLANTSGLKVGITRGSQIPTRWIDQGATQALPLYRVSSRRIAGLVEVLFKDHIADKTNWRAMLKGDPDPADLLAQADRLKAEVAAGLFAIENEHGVQAVQSLDDAEVTTITYPVQAYPEKVTSLNLEKQPEIEGELRGIKGQYLILDQGVINLRKYGGYAISLTC